MRDRWEDWFQPGEVLIWEGAPQPMVRSLFQGLFFTAFGLPFLGAGLFVSGMGLGYLFGFADDWSLWHIALGIFLTAFGVPFIAVGAGMVFGPWVYAYLSPRRFRYALSNRNGYIASRLWTRKMEVLPIRADTRIETETHKNGCMSIWFYAEHYKDSDGDDASKRKGFVALEDGMDVYRLIRAQQDRLRNPEGP